LFFVLITEKYSSLQRYIFLLNIYVLDSQFCFILERLVTTANINGYHFPSDFVHIESTSNVVIDGVKTFKNLHLKNDTNLRGNLNSINLTEWMQQVVLKYGNKTVTGEKFFLNGLSVTNLVTNHFQNMNLSQLLNDVLVMKNNATISTDIHFQMLKSLSNLNIVGTVNGYRVPDDLVFLGTDQNVLGNKVFVQNSNISNIQNIGMLNEEDFANFISDAVTDSTNQEVITNVTFQNNIYFHDNIVIDTLNQRPVSDWVTLHTEQNITGFYSFSEDTLFQSTISADTIIVNGTVNSIDISEMEREAVYKDKNHQTINSRLVFVAGIDCKQNLSVAGLINGVNLTELFNSTVRISMDQTVTGKKTFTNNVKLDNELTTTGTINSVNVTKLDSESVKRTGEQILKGNITMYSDLNVGGEMDVDGLVNDIDLVKLLEEAALETNRSVVVNGTLSFDQVTMKDTETNTVNGINLTNILLQDQNQTVYAAITFENITTGNVEVDLINQINISDIAERSMKVNENQNITARYTFTNVNVTGDVQVQQLNQVDVELFKTNAVHLNANSTITGNLVFNEDVIVEDLEMTGLVNNVNISLILSDALMKQGSGQTVCHRMEYKSNVTMDNVKFTAISSNQLINNVSVDFIANNSIYLRRNNGLLNSDKFTFKNLFVSSTISVDKVNSYDLSEDFLKTYGDQYLPQITFDVPVYFTGNLSFEGDYIDGVNLTHMVDSSISYNSDAVVSGHKTFTNLSMADKRSFVTKPDGTINNIKPIEFVLVDINQTLAGLKEFHNIDVEKLTVQEEINGIDLTKFYRDALQYGDDYNLLSDQVFTQDLTIVGK